MPGAQDLFEAIEDQRSLVLVRGTGRGWGTLPGGRKENDGRDHGRDPIDEEHASDAEADGKKGGQHHAQHDAHVHGQRSKPRGGGALLDRKPTGRHGGDGVEDEGLPNGNADLGDEDQ